MGVPWGYLGTETILMMLMKMHRTLAALWALAAIWSPAFAVNDVYPRPQQSKFSTATVKATSVTAAIRTADSKGGVWDKLPSGKAGAYSLSISDDGKVEVCANDEAGLFYAKQTLSQLLEGVPGALDAQKDPFPSESIQQVAAKGALPVGTIMDWPDLPYRGMVEGYYGRPWSFDEICNQMDFFGRNKMNIFIYAPKDDPYHHGKGCYLPYPEAKAKELTALVEQAKRNHVRFVWAIHPADTVKWADNNGKNELDGLCHKLELMYKLGFRDFAVLVDDSSGEIGTPERQADLSNYILHNFIRKHPDVNQELIMCPTGYNRAWTSTKFLRTLGTRLHPSIHVMWTGDTVVHDITLPGQKWVHDQVKRPTFIWWNWPTTDYKRSRLSMGRTYGLDTAPEMAMEMSGFVANPMEHAESSKIGLFGVADYTWNITGFQSEPNWKTGIRRLFPGIAEEMRVFCNHNSYLLPNYHKYVREESVDFAPIAKTYQDALIAGTDTPECVNPVRYEFAQVLHAGKVLSEAPEAAVLRKEIGPWITRFRMLGQIGMLSLDAIYARDVAYCHQALFEAMDLIAEARGITRDQWSADGKVKQVRDLEVARLVLFPAVEATFDFAGKQLYADYTGKDVIWPKPVFTCQGGNAARGTEYILDGLPDTNWGCGQRPKVGDWYCFDFGSPMPIKTLALFMGGEGPHYPAQGQFEYSLDGEHWEPIGIPNTGRVATKDLGDEPVMARMVRYRILKTGPGWLAINEFTVNKPLPPIATADVEGLEGVFVQSTARTLSIAGSPEVHTIQPGQSIEMLLPSPMAATSLTIDLANESIADWAEIILKLEDRTETTVHARVDEEAASTLIVDKGNMPAQGLRAARIRNAGTTPQEIKLAAFYLIVPEADPDNSPANLLDVDFATYCDCSAGFSATLDVPKGATQAVVFGLAPCTIDGQAGKQEKSHVRTFDLAPGTSRVKLEAPPTQGTRIHEVIFR